MPDRTIHEHPAAAGTAAGIDSEYEEDASIDEDWEDLDGSEEEEEEWLSSAGWRQTGAAAAGLALGLLLGAGVALLFAPRTGEETRELLGDSARRIRGRAGDRMDDLRDELARVARRGRRGVRRSVTRGRWKAEDLIDRARW